MLVCSWLGRTVLPFEVRCHVGILPVGWDYSGVDGGLEYNRQDWSHFGCQLSEDSGADGIGSTCFAGLQILEKSPHPYSTEIWMLLRTGKSCEEPMLHLAWNSS